MVFRCTKNKSKTYVLFTDNYVAGKPPEYVDSEVGLSCVRAITRFITRNHRLVIETGCWARPKIEKTDRKCIVCDELDDEKFVVLHCPLYTSLRELYLGSVTDKSDVAFVNLFDTNVSKDLYNMSHFINKANELHKAIYE